MKIYFNNIIETNCHSLDSSGNPFAPVFGTKDYFTGFYLLSEFCELRLQRIPSPVQLSASGAGIASNEKAEITLKVISAFTLDYK